MKIFFKITRPVLAFRYIKGATGLLLFLIFCNPVFAFEVVANNQIIIISNAASFSRKNEVIAIQRKLLSKVTGNLFPIVKKGNSLFTTQIIDQNKDGDWDELLIEVSLAAHSKDTLQISWVKREELPAFKKMTNVQLSLRSDNTIPSAEIKEAVRYRGFTQNIAKPYYQMEGPGIENDKVAFRAFFDYRNSKDIYGKIVDTPVLERVGVGAGWHELQPWGMDIFHTGNSLGAGGLAIEENKQIIRLGDADTSTFLALYEGVLKAAFILSFKKWDVGSGKKDGSETISMTKGDFYYKDLIRVDLNRNQKLIAGIANFGIDQVVYKKYNNTFSSVSTYGNQAEGTNTKLGVAILFPSDDYIENKTTDTLSSIPNTSYAALKPSGEKTIYFFACWEKTDQRFSSQQGFEQYVEETANQLSNPITIKLINK